MANDNEKKVLIDVKITDNFEKTKANVDFWKSALEDADNRMKALPKGADEEVLPFLMGKAESEQRATY